MATYEADLPPTFPGRPSVRKTDGSRGRPEEDRSVTVCDMKPHTQSPTTNSLEHVDVFGHAFRAAVGLLFTGIEAGTNSLNTFGRGTDGTALGAVR